jgi:hypothetical protein
MKTMQLLIKSKTYLFIILFSIVSASLFADTNWELAIVFLSNGNDPAYNLDVENNIKEIQKINSSNFLKIKVFKEEGKTDLKKINTFIKSSLSSKSSKKGIILYGHGEGAMGFKNFSTLEFKNDILKSLPQLDFIWLDACFMSNLEFLFEIKNFSSFTIASEDAEFSSGMPFTTLKDLPLYSDSKKAAQFLASEYINSYSFIKKGNQIDNVLTSSATISVIENSKLLNFVQKFKFVSRLISSLTDEQKNKLQKSILKYSMDKNDFIDLGHLLINLRTINKDTNIDKNLSSLLRDLNITSVAKTKTNPRIKIDSPSGENLLIYSFNNWKNGSENDYSENSDLYNKIIRPDGFILGPNNQKWPYKKVTGQTKYLTPFAPGVNSFSYYFQNVSNENQKSTVFNFNRSQDFVEVLSTTQSSPLLYFAYTQKVGKLAEKYSGMTIASPFSTMDIDYFDMELNQLVEWLKM